MLAVAPATAIRLWFLLSAYRADAICAFWAAPARWRSSDPGCFGVVASASPLRVNSCLRIMNRSPTRAAPRGYGSASGDADTQLYEQA
jgi:hypothetical protein